MLHLEVVNSFARAQAPAIVFDFDGTVSPIVDDPLEARLVGDLGWILADLESRVRLLALVSSRPVNFLANELSEDLSFMTLVGYNGLEVLADDELDQHLIRDEYKRRIRDALEDARHISFIHPDIRVEDNQLSFTIHYRLNYKLYQTAKDAAYALALRHGLVVSEGRMSFQVAQNTGMDKGKAISELLLKAPAVDWLLYAGDSADDMTAFYALDQLDEITTVKVAVDSSETSKDLRMGADLTLRSPEEFKHFLGDLLNALPQAGDLDEVDLRHKSSSSD